MTSIHDCFNPTLDVSKLAGYLDGLTNAERIAQVTTLSAKEQAMLWDAAKGFGTVSVDDIVPPSREPLAPLPHWGRNSLPVFTRFQKVFCRPDDSGAQKRRELWGYNNQTMAPLTGPGYYVAYDVEGGEVLIDYTRLPPKGAPGWPEVIPNSARLGFLVYNGMQDRLRRVSKHVTIGRANKGGKDMDNWFVLCREDV